MSVNYIMKNSRIVCKLGIRANWWEETHVSNDKYRRYIDNTLKKVRNFKTNHKTHTHTHTHTHTYIQTYEGYLLSHGNIFLFTINKYPQLESNTRSGLGMRCDGAPILYVRE